MYQWSCDFPESFWELFWSYSSINTERNPTNILKNGDEEYFLKITENGTYCLDCRREADPLLESKKADKTNWEREVEKGFNTNANYSKRTILDEDGNEVAEKNKS